MKEIKEIEVDGIRHKHTSVEVVCIFPEVKYKEHDYKEPVLYIQTKRKSKKGVIVKEHMYPLSKVTYMR